MAHLFLDLPTWLASATHASDVLQTVQAHVPHDWLVLAQQFKEPDMGGDVAKTWNHFVKTGQVWAFLVGLVGGYLVKTFTSFG